METNIKNPFDKEISYSISDNDFCKYIRKIFNLKNFEILEVSNDTSLSFYIQDRDKEEYKNTDWWKKHAQSKLKEITKNKSCEEWNLHVLFEYLWLEGYIEPGKYYIHVSW